MKLNEDMLFGHPVLSPVSDDYQGALFNAEFVVNVEDNDHLSIEATIGLNSPDLDQLLEEGGAGCGFFLVCRQTYQNRLIEMGPGKATHQLNAHHFFGTLQLRPVVWSKEARSGWRSRYLHPEYGGRTDFPAATILAVGEEQRFSLDRERLKPFESIFTLAAVDNLRPGEISVDPDGEKITIGVQPDTKDSIDLIRNDPRGRIVLLNSIYLPAVMQVLTDLTSGTGNYDEKAWHRIFSAKCAQCGFDPTNAVPLEHAQRLLGYPFARIDEQKEKLFP